LREGGELVLYDDASPEGRNIFLSNAEVKATIWDGDWHCLEIEMDLGNTTLKCWVDGVSMYSSTTHTWLATGHFDFMQHFGVGNTYDHNWDGQASWQAFEFDDLIISDTYNGPDAGTSKRILVRK